MKKKNKKTAPNGRSSTFREQEKWGSQKKKKEQVIYLTLSVVIF
jgi:hypothetical protein